MVHNGTTLTPAENTLKSWFYLFLFAHLVLWTLVPAVVRENLPLDAIEGTIWGHQLEWGYDKNPFLNGWLTALAGFLSEPSGWAIYLFSQLSVVASFFAVWQIAKRMLPPTYALLSVLLLEGIQYYNFHAIDFNDNTLELGLWALGMYAYYQALRSRRVAAWVLTGVFMGLAMMAKYYTAVLLASMALFLLVNADNRKQLATFAPYLGLLTFLGIILPHIFWLFSHDFITIKYVFARAGAPPSWTNHFFFPAQFAWQQGEAFLPACLLLLLFLIGKKPRLATTRIQLDKFNREFLFYVGLGPFILTLLLSLCLGTNLRAGWGMPLMSLWGIILITLVQPAIHLTKIKRFLVIIYGLLALLLTGYTLSLTHSSDTSTANYPGRKVAAALTQTWHDRYHTKLNYIAGSRWVGGNIGFYSKDHPAVFIEWDTKRAPWVDIALLKKHGGIFVWDITGHESLPADIKKTFPELGAVTILEFDWHRNHAHLPPAKVGVAFLPPTLSS